MVLYPLAGALLFTVVYGSSAGSVSFMHPDHSQLPSLRLIQMVGQMVLLALPALLLAGWHTAKKNPFSKDAMAFLGIGQPINFGAALLAVAGIFLLQPLLHTLTELQDLYLWPSLGAAGSEVVRQRELMDSFMRTLALVRSLPEFMAVAAVFALTPAICEELLFRGYIQQNYTRSLSGGGAVWLTGFVFAIFHLSAANLLPLALLGWYIGYIYSKSGNLFLPFFVHLFNNLAALFLLLSGDKGEVAKHSQPELLVHTLWWWLVVAGSLLLFMMVIRHFSRSLLSES